MSVELKDRSQVALLGGRAGEAATKIALRSIGRTAMTRTAGTAEDFHGKPTAAPIPKGVRIQLFGPMLAITHAGQILLPRGRRARLILACLCLANGKSVTRARLATLLWDRVPEAQARGSLRHALLELVKAMAPAPGLVIVERERVRLDASRCWIDVHALMDPTPTPVDVDHQDIFQGVNGQLLEGLEGVNPSCDAWLQTERSNTENQLRRIHDRRLTDLLDRRPSPQTRIRAARNVIEFDPVHELGWRTLLSSLIELGDRGRAIREYQTCRQAFHNTLDIEPSAELRALHEAARSVAEAVEGNPIVNAETRPIHRRRDRMRVAILPFLDRSGGDPYLASSLGMDTAAALARFRWFDVIAPMALPMLTGDPGGWGPLLTGLDLDYAVHGVLHTLSDRIVVKIVLLDVRRLASPIWSDSYDLPLDAIGEADEHVTRKLVARIDPVILFIEGNREEQREPSDPTGLVLRAIPLLHSYDRSHHDEAGELLRTALDAGPENSMAHAWMAYWLMGRLGQGWLEGSSENIAQVEAHSRKAIQLDPENALAMGVYGHVRAFVYFDFVQAQRYFERALLANPNLAFVWSMGVATSCYVGALDEARFRLQRYRQLAPFDPHSNFFDTVDSLIDIFARDYESAALSSRRCVRENPGFTNGYKSLLCALGHLERLDEAAVVLSELLNREPGFTVAGFSRTYPFARDEDREAYIDGLRKAGAPEG